MCSILALGVILLAAARNLMDEATSSLTFWIFRSSYAIDLFGLGIDIFHIAFFMFVTKVTYVNYWSNKRRREVPGKEEDEPSALYFY